MLSPGSSKAAPCAANSLVTISKVIRCALLRAEKIIYSSKIFADSSSGNPQIKMLQARMIFQKKIFEARILLSRLLVVIRWSKTMHMTKKDSLVDNLFSGPEVHIQNTFYEISQCMSKSRLKTFPKINDSKLDLNNFDKGLNAKNNVHFTQLLNLFSRGVPKRIQTISKSGKSLIFIAPGEYSFILKSDKHGNLRLSSYKISVPKYFHFSEEIILLLTRLLLFSLNHINSALPRIDRVLHTFYLYSMFGKIVKSICDSHENYPINCEGSSFPPSINLIFPSLYGPLSSFRLGIQMGKITVSSVGTVYLPPTSEEDSLSPLDTFNRINQARGINYPSSTNNNESYSGYNKSAPTTIQNHHQLTFVIENNFGQQDLLLSFLRDTALYTKFIKVWNTTKHVIRSVSFSYFNCKMIYNSKMSTFGRIEISLKKNIIITISIDTWTGAIQLKFSNQSTIGLSEMTFSCIEPEEISTLMSQVLTNFAVHKAVETVYGVKVPSNVFLKNPKNYSRCFSFAPDFSLHFYTDFGHPHVCIFDNDFNQYSSPDIVEMDSSTTINSWKLLERTLQSSKALVFLLQTQKSLQELGIQSVRTGLKLDINLPMCRSCSLVINKDGWCLLYSHFNTFGRIKVTDLASNSTLSTDLDLDSYLKLTPDSDFDSTAISDAISDYSSSQIELSTVIRGYSNLARSAEIIAHIIINLHQTRSNFFNIIMLARRTLAIEPPYLSNSNEMILRFQNDARNTLILTFGKNMKYCGTCNKKSFYEMSPYSIPEFQLHFLSQTPIQWMINSAIPNRNDVFALSSFINHSAIPFFKFSEIFSNIEKSLNIDDNYKLKSRPNDFIIIPLYNTLRLLLVYKNKYTLWCRLNPFHSFYIIVPPSYPSVFLIIPLTTVKKDLSSQTQGGRYYEVPMSNLEKMREIIVTFVDFYEEVVKLDFKCRGFLKTIDQVNFYYDGFSTVKLFILISGKNFKLHINNNEITEIISKITEHAGLDHYLLHGLFNVIKLLSTQPFCPNFDVQNQALYPHKYLLYIFSLVNFLMQKINLPLLQVAKMLNSLHLDQDNFLGNEILMMNVEKSRNERFFLMFEKNQANLAELKTKFILKGMQPTEIGSFDDLLVLINQQNTYLSVF